MTLIELLVVVTILLLAAALFVPRLKPMMDHSKVREAARVIQLYLNTARNQAMTSGRSCGVMIEPLTTEPGCSMTLTQVETPTPFGGDSSFATATTLSGTANGFTFPTVVWPYAIVPIQFNIGGGTANAWPSVPLYEGDQIQLGYQGFWYNVAPTNSSGIVPGTNIPLNKVDTTTSIIQPTNFAVPPPAPNPLPQCVFIYLDISHGELPSFLTTGVFSSFKIRRWPAKSGTKALQLPATTCIDLTASGYDPPANLTTSATWSTASTTSPPVIMFAPDGTVDRTYVQKIDPKIPPPNNKTYKAEVPVTPIYLLVGMRNKVNPNNPKDANLNDFNSLWISIDPSSGLILITDPAAIPADPTNVVPADYLYSRDNARKAMANGGGK
jgi:type II secretory pathway pseudopilin PulG